MRLALIILFLGVHQIKAQLLTNEFIQFTPLYVNPALTGAFDGNLRFNTSLLRSKNSLSNRTIHTSIDGNINVGFSEGDWISLGSNFSRSTLGLANLRQEAKGISLAYHLNFGKASKKILSLAFYYGNNTNNFSTENVLIDPNILVTQTMQDIEFWTNTVLDPSFDRNSEEFELGAMLTMSVNKSSDIKLGLSFNKSEVIKTGLPRNQITVYESIYTLSSNINYRLSLTKKVSLYQNVIYLYSKNNSLILSQSLFHFCIDEKNEYSLIAGIGYRHSQHHRMPMYFGFSIKGWNLGISTSNNLDGGFTRGRTWELGLSKVLKWNNKSANRYPFRNWYRSSSLLTNN